MAANERWYFTKEQLTNTPSRRCGIDANKELSYRQQAANFIQDMGQHLVVSQLCINTAIVYMHRFYMFHSLSQFHRNAIAAAAIFLAARVEEQPQNLECVIKMAHLCLHRDQSPPDIRSKQYLEQAQDLLFNENVLLRTLGFDVAIDHPHTHVIRCCQLIKASKDLARTSYVMASNSLHWTTMCLQYKPTVVACFCIHLASKWSNWEDFIFKIFYNKDIFPRIPQSKEGRHWFWYVDKTVTAELLQQLTAEFLHIFDKCPSRLKKKIESISANQSPSVNHGNVPNLPFDPETRKIQFSTTCVDGITSHPNRPHHAEKQDDKKSAASGSTRPSVDYREYREKKERERLEREKASGASTVDAARMADASKHQVPTGQKTAMHHNHHHRTDAKTETGQLVSQRHSTGNQPRDFSRDPNRQRVTSDFLNTVSGATMHSSHVHASHSSKESNSDNYDPRHKVEHRKDCEQKPYKYTEPQRLNRNQRKPDMFEQRCEEIRKLLENPLPLPKPAIDTQYSAIVQKQHHSKKYNQVEKLQSSVGMDNKLAGQASLQMEKLPTLPSSQIPQKPQLPLPKPVSATQHSSTHGLPQILKDTVKNGTSQVNNEETRSDKRPQHEESSLDLQHNLVQTPPGKHKSLFSPEKTVPSSETHSQRAKSKEKTPPSLARMKVERNTFLSFGTLLPYQESPIVQQQNYHQQQSQTQQQQQQQHFDSIPMKRPNGDAINVPHKKQCTSSVSNEWRPLRHQPNWIQIHVNTRNSTQA